MSNKNTISLPSQNDIDGMTMKEITVVYNEIVEALGDPKFGEVRKFRDLATSKARLASIMEAYGDAPSPSQGTKPAKAKPAKAKPSKGSEQAKASKPAKVSKNALAGDLKLTVRKPDCREGTIRHAVIAAINEEMCSTVDEVVEHMEKTYKKPRTGEGVDRPFITATLKYFINEKTLEAS